MKERTKLFYLVGLYLAAYLVPWSDPVVRRAGLEAFLMLREYAREHVLFCLVPAFFIAGAISVFVSQGAVLKYFGAKARKIVSYTVASVSGGVLAVCSCTVLPLFAGIYTRGAGIGPATTFLYAGPAINVLAVVLTAQVLGWKLGLARAVGAVVFSVVAGLIMSAIFSREEKAREEAAALNFVGEEEGRGLGKNGAFIGTLVLVLVFAAFARPGEDASAVWKTIFGLRWYAVAAFLVALAWMVRSWFSRDEAVEWVDATWEFTKQIMPLLAIGVLVAGFLLGRPGHPALIPAESIGRLVGGNSLWANLFASLAGALMYFATLTEVPILQGLLGAGMGQGPALALLLAGPALSLPNMLVIVSVMGVKKTAAFVAVVVVLSTTAGMIFGTLVG
ncbi:MAG: permease [Proteobacteria bacterium]|nr:permease [Pseudomonadota bacterium]